MDKRTRESFSTVLRPLFIALGIVFKAIDTVLFGWLHWWMQRRANDHLAVEVLSSLYFLSPPAVRLEGRTAVLPFNYAEVKVMYENICFTVARGRGEVNVSLSLVMLFAIHTNLRRLSPQLKNDTSPITTSSQRSPML